MATEGEIGRKGARGLTLETRALARLAALLWIGCGGLVVIAGSWLPLGEDASRSALIGVGALALLVGTAVWFAPWDPWAPRATLVLVPVAFTVIAAFNWAARDPWLYDVFSSSASPGSGSHSARGRRWGRHPCSSPPTWRP